jgi:DNA-binding MarR family transcriptional regulator
MKIEDEIQQKEFRSQMQKTLINIIFTANWLNLKFTQSLKHYDLSLPQFNVLRILRGQKGCPATVNGITERMLDKSSNASRLVDKLKAKGLVERRECPNDRRAVDVLITDKGLDLLKELDKEVSNMENNLTQLEQGEMKTLNNILDKLRQEDINREELSKEKGAV